MMSAEFLVVFACSFIALFFWYGVPQLSVGKRLFIINLIFVSYFLESPLAAAPVVAFAVVGYGAIHLVGHYRFTWALLVSIFLMVCLFATTKRYSVIAELSIFDFLYTTVGLSYLLFRILHLMIDVSQGAIEKTPRPLEYFNYLFFFLSFVSGPIQRYQDHQVHIVNTQEKSNINQIRQALSRIITGLVKVVMIASVANQIIISIPLSMSPDEQAHLGIFSSLPSPVLLLFYSAETGDSIIRFTFRFITHSYAFLVYLYFNFSGYMDIVIGIGRLFGFRVSENFDKPFEAENFLDFWSRWHMTLSGWFKFYLFNPFLKLMAETSKNVRPNAYLAVPAFFVTFLIMGIWHGTNYAFVVYGLLLGAGVSLNKMFQLLAVHFFGRSRYKSLAENPLYQLICRGATTSYFTLSLVCLWLEIEQLEQVLKLFGALGLIKLLIFTSIVTTLIFVVWEQSLSSVRSWPAQISNGAFVVGLLYLAAVWGDIAGFKTLMLETLPGNGLPDSIIASIGAALIVFSLAVTERSKNLIQPAPTAQLSVRVTLMFFAFLLYTGAVPEFVYKGF